jgi:hypothetical protein
MCYTIYYYSDRNFRVAMAIEYNLYFQENIKFTISIGDNLSIIVKKILRKTTRIRLKIV